MQFDRGRNPRDPSCHVAHASVFFRLISLCSLPFGVLVHLHLDYIVG